MPLFDDFDFQPTLEGELLTLRPLQPEDYDDLFAAASDPLIWEQHPDFDRYQPDVYREFFRVALATGKAFVAIENASGRIIGSSRYYVYQGADDRVDLEIGWSFLARSHWGGMYNGEMKRLLLEHAFSTVESVIFVIGPDNIRSYKAVEKIGGVRDGIAGHTEGEENYLYRVWRSARSAPNEDQPR